MAVTVVTLTFVGARIVRAERQKVNLFDIYAICLFRCVGVAGREKWTSSIGAFALRNWNQLLSVIPTQSFTGGDVSSSGVNGKWFISDCLGINVTKRRLRAALQVQRVVEVPDICKNAAV
jgi:hypothetical protein